MDKSGWDSRRQGLEDEFFVRQNREAVEKLRSSQARETQIAELAKATGVKDPKVLGNLVDLGVTGAVALPLTLVPLVRVAWADGKIDASENAAILKAAAEHGIDAASQSYELLLSWLKQPPPTSLFDSWSIYVSGLRDVLSAGDFTTLRTSILGRARTVATAAGGFLGLGSKISEAEERELKTLEKAFG